MPAMKRWQVIRGDTVKVIQGAETGKSGVVKEVHRGLRQVIVENVNVKEMKVRNQQPGQNSTVHQEMPLHVSDVALVSPTTGEVVKTGFKKLEDGTRTRVVKKTGEVIPIPEGLVTRRHLESPGGSDTLSEHVLAVTYRPA